MIGRAKIIIDDIVFVIAKIPWWLHLLFALLSFLIVHYDVLQSALLSSESATNHTAVISSGTYGLSLIGQYLLPFLFLLGTLIAVIYRWKRNNLYRSVLLSENSDSLNLLSIRDFKFLVGEYFTVRGFVIEADQSYAGIGPDFVVSKTLEKYFILCRQYRGREIGREELQELLADVDSDQATAVILVTTGKLSKEAKVAAHENNVALISGKELHNNMRSFDANDFEPKVKKLKPYRKSKWIAAGIVAVIAPVVFMQLVEPGSPLLVRVSDLATKFFVSDLTPKKEEGNLEREKKDRYSYEIELISGGWIYIDNAEFTENSVNYTDERGLAVSIIRDEIKTMKRVKNK